MPSSLIFAALATAWLVVLVPMIAKRRQEAARTTDSVSASRVLRRRTHRAAPDDGQETPQMSERIAGSAPDERRYRPGRGGFDPEAAALAARAKYLFRQRVVLGLLIGAVTTLVLAVVVSSRFWWLHAAFDVVLIGYLAYLRRQVRIEEEVRARRAARMAGSRPWSAEMHAREGPSHHGSTGYDSAPSERSQYEQYDRSPYDRTHNDGSPYYDESSTGRDPDGGRSPNRHAMPPPRAHPTAVPLDLDDEDPLFDELDPAFQPRYRPAAGE